MVLSSTSCLQVPAVQGEKRRAPTGPRGASAAPSCPRDLRFLRAEARFGARSMAHGQELCLVGKWGDEVSAGGDGGSRASRPPSPVSEESGFSTQHQRAAVPPPPRPQPFPDRLPPGPGPAPLPSPPLAPGARALLPPALPPLGGLSRERRRGAPSAALPMLGVKPAPARLHVRSVVWPSFHTLSQAKPRKSEPRQRRPDGVTKVLPAGAVLG